MPTPTVDEHCQKLLEGLYISGKESLKLSLEKAKLPYNFLDYIVKTCSYTEKTRGYCVELVNLLKPLFDEYSQDLAQRLTKLSYSATAIDFLKNYYYKMAYEEKLISNLDEDFNSVFGKDYASKLEELESNRVLKILNEFFKEDYLKDVDEIVYLVGDESVKEALLEVKSYKDKLVDDIKGVLKASANLETFLTDLKTSLAGFYGDILYKKLTTISQNL
jgi:hypothetical protein